MSAARNAIANVKNRLVLMRYVYKCTNTLSRLHRRIPAAPFPEVAADVRPLEHQGFVETAVDNVDVAEFRKWADDRAAVYAGKPSVNYPFRDLLIADDFRDANSPVMDFAFSDQLLSAASWYFGGRPKLTRCFLAHSVPDPHKHWKQTQLWHFDSDDFKMLRAVLYLSDVDQGAGPFMYIPKSKSPRNGAIWSSRLRDEELADSCPEPDPEIRSFEGGPGSLLLIDSAKCLHCGGRAESRERLAMVVTFTTQAPCNRRHPLLTKYRHEIYESIRQSKPHLSELLLRNLLL